MESMVSTGRKKNLKIIGRNPPINYNQQIYNTYKFNKLDALLREQGFSCRAIYDLGGLQFPLKEIRELIRGEAYYYGRPELIRGRLEDQFLIIPAMAVLTTRSLNQLTGRNPFSKHPGPNDYYAIYFSEKSKHTEFAQTERWKPEKKIKK